MSADYFNRIIAEHAGVLLPTRRGGSFRDHAHFGREAVGEVDQTVEVGVPADVVRLAARHGDDPDVGVEVHVRNPVDDPPPVR